MSTPFPDNRATFTIEEIVSATRGTLMSTLPNDRVEVRGVVSDSRAVARGGVFVALRGETHDGHSFLEAAGRKGAAVALVERGKGEAIAGLAVVEVDDTLVAWGDLAQAHLEKWREARSERRVVAITGSAGKTTTKELSAALLGAVGPTHFTAGNLNNRIGVPSVVFALEDKHRFAVLEMGMSLPGELDAITAFAPPDVSVVTNVGVAHAEGVGGREGVMREKGAVYRALGRDGVAIVNADDAYAERAAQGTPAKRVVTFGRSEGARYRLVDRVAEGSGSRVTITRPGGAVTVLLPIPGEVAAIDLAAALAAQEAASDEILSASAIEKALGSIDLKGRANVRTIARDILLLDDTYNANPASMRAALATLAEIAGSRRRVAILGEMKELGPLAEEEHDALGDVLAGSGVALAIGCGGLATRTIERAKANGLIEAIAAKDTLDAAKEALARVKEGDAVLVKGSRGVAAERVVAALVSWPNATESASSRTS
jgi:UDP-N-acetylmuramoyl-tripeptide--D-alanyl-D-alanine ligase